MDSYRILEYDKIKAILKKYCISEISRLKIDQVKPESSIREVEKSFKELEELIKITENGFDPVLPPLNPMDEYLKRASPRGSCLGPEELVQIKENVENYSLLKKRFKSFSHHAPLLIAKLKKVSALPGVKEAIERSIDEHGKIRGDASNKLKQITDEIKGIKKSIENILEGYFENPVTSHYIQERHITLKEDRYVIPVKHGFKGQIPGVIHAYSGSGETVFLEPFSITEKNNRIKILEKEKEREIRKILSSLTSMVRKYREQLKNIEDSLIWLDILQAKYRFFISFQCTIPGFTSVREIEIKNARHPLIIGEVVPVDITLRRGVNGVVITGPNTGGKTVSLKTVGLFLLMARSGLPVPAESMNTFFFDPVFADIGDESSIEQSLSTFSAHIKNIKQIVQKAHKKSLVLIDELGAGTDPLEGGAIGTAVLDYLLEKDVCFIVTTHFSIIKSYAIKAERIDVASVQFDLETLKPLYRLAMGIPGRSHALEIARQLGLDEEIIQKTNRFLGEKELEIDTLVRSLGSMELKLSRMMDQVKKDKEDVEKLKQHYENKLEDVEGKEEYIKKRYRRELQGILEEYRKRLESRIKELRVDRASKDSIIKAREEAEKIEQDFYGFEEKEGLEKQSQNIPVQGKLHPGDQVIIHDDYGSRVEGVVVNTDNQKITVQAGRLKITLPCSRVFSKKKEKKEAVTNWQFEAEASHEKRVTGSNVCDLRGMRYEEAMTELSRFLDLAILDNLNIVNIIHGLGTGVLRQGVWDFLSRQNYVETYHYALPEQGGFGCTVVKLKDNY